MTTMHDATPGSLARQPVGFHGRIVAGGALPVSERLRELGFVPGTRVSILRRGPLGDPIHIELRGYRICLRALDLSCVHVELAEPVKPPASK